MTLREQLSYCKPTKISALAFSELRARFFAGVMLYFHQFCMDLDQRLSGEEMPPTSLSNPMCHSPNKNAVTISKRLLYFQAMRSKRKAVVLNLMLLNFTS